MSTTIREVRAGVNPPPRPPLGPLRRSVREVGLALITAGVIVLLFVLYQLVGTNFAEEHSQQQLAKQFNQALAQTPATSTPATSTPATSTPATSTETTAPPTKRIVVAPPVAATVSTPPGGALAHLVIPKIGVDKYVVEGVAESDLEKGPGHYVGTALPGQLGNVGIAGHRTTYGAPFYRLNELSTGDPVYLTTTSGAHYTYRVISAAVVAPGDVAVLDNTPTVARLTLTTCNPRFEATTRLVVTAQLAPGTTPAPSTPRVSVASPHRGSPSPAKPVAVGQAAADVNLGSGDGGAWPSVIGYGMITVAGWILVRLAVNRTRRWARLGAYLAGIAICLIPLWFLFENVAHLLPQNI